MQNALSWFLHFSPVVGLRAQTAGVHFLELVVPCFLLLPGFCEAARYMRFFAAVLTALLQLAITLSGNYGFFNHNTAVLCFAALDDTLTPWSLTSTLVAW